MSSTDTGELACFHHDVATASNLNSEERAMNCRFVTSFASMAVLALAACSGGDKQPVAPVANAQGIVASADWSRAEQIDVRLSSYAFSPANLTLARDQPYKIHLVNSSGNTHTFSSDDLFAAIALRNVQKGAVSQTSIQGNGISLARDRQADLYLVPVKPGTYRIYCNEFMHDTMGMHGTVTIQ
jgi:plastocyanin